jgi:hypothetical protein
MEVCIVQRYLMHYRVPFFEALHSELKARGIHLRVIYGLRSNEEKKRNDEGRLAWGEWVQERVWRFRTIEVVQQPVRRLTQNSDLVILAQHNRFISNWFLLLFPFGRKTALWGHGRKGQASSQIRHYLRSRLARLPDWWFALSCIELYHKSVLDGLCTGLWKRGISQFW